MDGSIPEKKKDATVAMTLQAIIDEEGDVTPDRIVDLASKKTHPLHEYFEWDDNVAGHKYRLQQAMHMIRMWRMVRVFKHPNQPEPIEAAKVRGALLTGQEASEYGSRTKVLQTKTGRALFIEMKWSQLRAWCNEVRDVPEFDRIRVWIESRLPTPDRG